MGVSLFSEKRLVVVRGLSQNKMVWEALPDWLERLSDDIHLVLIESKPDKRTKAYKAIKKVATVHEFASWGERDTAQAERWLGERAASQGVQLAAPLVRLIVHRVGVDQWQLTQALDKLAVLDAIDEMVIRDTIEAQPAESVFELFETALRGDTQRLQEMIATLRRSEDPFQLFGLLSGQAVQLAALAVAPAGAAVAQDIGAHSFALSKLRSHAAQRGAKESARIIQAFAEADQAMKRSSADPWLFIERALLAVATT